jgi:hypothetical protein
MKVSANCCFCKERVAWDDFCTVGKKKQAAHDFCAMDYFKEQKALKKLESGQ